VKVLNALDQLVGEHQHRLERELTVAHVVQILERRAEQLDAQHVVVLLLSKVQHGGNADHFFCRVLLLLLPLPLLVARRTAEQTVETILVRQLRTLCRRVLELDSHLCVLRRRRGEF
jgi:hypothetical protein